MYYCEYMPDPQLSGFVRYFWVFEKRAEDTLFERDVFFPEVDSIMVFQVKGAVCVESDHGTRHTTGKIAVLAGAKKSIDASFPGEHLLVGVSLKPGAARMLGLFSPQEVHGLASFDFAASNRVIDICRDLYKESDIAALLEPVKEYLYQRFRQYSESLFRNQVSVLDRIPPFGSRLCSGAGSGGLSLRQIERISLMDSGYTPQQFAALKACTIARKLIFTKTYNSFSNLALDLGFYDQPHFCRVFKRWCGMSPREYDYRFASFRYMIDGKCKMVSSSLLLEDY